MQCLKIKEEVEEFLEIETSVHRCLHRSYVPKLFLSKHINQEVLYLGLSFGFLGGWVGFSCLCFCCCIAFCFLYENAIYGLAGILFNIQ